MFDRTFFIRLGEAMQRQSIDHVFVVCPDGRVVDGPTHLMAPDVCHDPDGDVIVEVGTPDGKWSAITGMTGQYGYRGAVMHPSEYIGPGVAERVHQPDSAVILAAVEVRDEDGDFPDDPIGWCLVEWTPKHSEYPHEPGALHDCLACQVACWCGVGGVSDCVAHANDNPVIPGGLPRVEIDA